ncbi:MAG: efflux RND transporter periplasmic adaptor subunit [Gemmatimonadetes bacterium]|jgi:membrane fusion protein, multidrug efflux system|nr:efflux RND transporter periplasmic adaptor subunit [Gemmatimonadota bacterium]
MRTRHLALPFILLLTACQQEGPKIDVESSIPVRVAPVTRQPIEEYITATTTVLPSMEAELRTLQSGRYQLQTNPRTDRLYAMGDRVLAGETIVRLANPEFENTVSIDSKKLHFTISEREFEKQQALFEKGGITRRELTDAERLFIDSRYAYENAGLQLEKLTIEAPFDGVLVDLVHYNPEQLLEAGAALGELMDYETLYAELSLPGGELSRVSPGQRALVTHYGGGADAPSDTLDGQIDQVSPVLDQESRMFKATLTVVNDSLRIRPGMFVRVDIVADARDSALVVPKDALLDRGTNRIAFVVEKGIAFERKLETGLSNRFKIEIISGLEEEDRLVVEGFETLRNRAKVKVEK